jgi:hypothetical protein
MTTYSNTHMLQLFYKSMIGQSEVSGSLAVLHRKSTSRLNHKRS